jgi:hypothetical protein
MVSLCAAKIKNPEALTSGFGFLYKTLFSQSLME